MVSDQESDGFFEDQPTGLETGKWMQEVLWYFCEMKDMMTWTRVIAILGSVGMAVKQTFN